MVVRAVIADERVGLRASLRALLESQPDMAVVGEAEGPSEAVLLARELGADVLVLGTGIAAAKAADAARALSAYSPATRVVLLSVNEQEREAALGGGVWAFVLSDAPSGELLEAVRSAAPAGTAAERTGTAAAARRRGAGAAAYALALVLLGAFVLMARPWDALTEPRERNPVLPETVAGPTFIEPVETYGLERNRHRVIARTSDPTTARLLDVDRGVTVAVNPLVSQRHALDWEVPEFTELEKTFTLRVELRDLDGRTALSDPVRVTIMRDSRAAGGIQRPPQLIDFLQQPDNASARVGFVAVLKAVAPTFPGVSQLNPNNVVGFVETNLGRFKVEPLTSPLTGRFAYLQADGTVRVGQMTLSVGTPVLTFDGKVLANALCLNELVLR